MGIHTFGGREPERGDGVIRRALEQFTDIEARFYDEDNETLVNVVDPVGWVTKDGNIITLQTTNTTSGSGAGYYNLDNVSLGEYKLNLGLHTLNPGLYQVNFQGYLDPYTEKLQGTFEVREETNVQYLIRRLRARLFDICKHLYRLDDLGGDHMFPDSILFPALEEALERINQSPPLTNFNLETMGGFNLQEMIVTGGWIATLRSRAVLEVFNEMSYSDGSSLTIDRSQKFAALADAEREDWNKRVLRWKINYGLYAGGRNVSFAGRGTVTMPLQVSRTLSMLPNLQRTFGV